MDTLDTLIAPARTPVRASAPQPHALEDRAPRSPVLDRYRLLDRLGTGGFGVVWRAHDELLDRHVAVKIIPLPAHEDRERAAREALATARLSHPAIVALYEACAADGAFYLISELVPGHTLAQLIAAEQLTDAEVLEIGLALIDALLHAHQRGVVHRDIKPQNVLVPTRPEGPANGDPAAQGSLPPAKLTDFGGALLAGEQSLTHTGDVLGTLAYMAPEQLDGHHVDAHADLYSLALVLYESLCGVNPVRGPTAAATARRIGCELPPLHRHRRDLPRELTQALDRALDPDPARRGTFPELRDVIAHTLQHSALSSPAWHSPRPAPAAPSRPPQAGPEGPVRSQPQTPALEHHELTDAQAHSDPAPDTAGWLTPQRLAWLLGALTICIWQIAAGRIGSGCAAICAVLPLVLLVRRPSPRWLAAALAPLLGLAGLAAAFPAFAGQPSRWRERALLGALGYWWLRLAEPLLDGPRTRLWLGAPVGTGATGSGLSTWERSPTAALDHAVIPLIGLALLLGAALWALAALLLPWIVRGRSATLDGFAVILWAAALAAAAPLLDRGLPLASGSPRGPGLQSPHGAILGAILGGAIAVGARAFRGPV